jgi:hypothetical protein
MAHHKDETLDALAEIGNVAQFVSFRPMEGRLQQGFCRISGYPANMRFDAPEGAVAAVLAAAADRKVNVRSYAPESPRSREFVYGIETVDGVMEVLERLSSEGLHLIVNETIDVADGGVSGVVQGETVEFAPDDTPRCVEKPGVASLPLEMALRMFQIVYGFEPQIRAGDGVRLEFSLHPRPRGHRGTHTLVWERELNVPIPPAATLAWPNRFSRHLGDKAYGLLMAHLLGAPVPKTLVIGRRVAPFSFGQETGSLEVWTRTCPAEPQPGLFTTVKGWVDPYRLLSSEDPDGGVLASVLCQAAVRARYSGAAVVGAEGRLLVEGRQGEGDRFMLGLDAPEDLPPEILGDVRALHSHLSSRLGPIRFEWVHDGERAWIVQLHRGGTGTTEQVVVPGDAEEWVRFEVSAGIEHLRRLLDSLDEGVGVTVIGEIGLTSHVADLLRKARRPSRLERALVE